MTHEELYNNLIKRIKEYHPAKNLSVVESAYILALKAHGGQMRQSGEPYIIHPLAVAFILADLELDLETIVAALLHDVIEDTQYSYQDIVLLFGLEVADIVDGVTKLKKTEFDLKLQQAMAKEAKEKAERDGLSEKSKDKIYREELQAENYRKMFLAMAKDIRVILLKIADRLHNMRTLRYKSPEKQKEIAQETLDIYAPLAHRLGISKLRYEIEDLSFRYLDGEAYYELADKISRKQRERLEYIKNIVEELKAKLSGIEIKSTVEGRPKHFFSIYKKMKTHEKTLDEIYDLFAVRVIVDTIADCYLVLGIVHDMYKPIPGRFKDYISVPKDNMYSSLHTVVIGPEGEPLEIQIRTWDMHRTAEYGIAAHWKYKEGKDGKKDKEEEKLAWLRQILDWQRDVTDNNEFLSALKSDLNVFSDNVYCFSPRGEIIRLVSGSTPIDFAYAIHSAIGNRMVGAKVNGSIVQINTPLVSGDRVEILTSQNTQGPSRDWLKICRTGQARNKINQWFKKENKEENIIKGNELLEKEAKEKGYQLSELVTAERKKAVLNRFGFNDWDSLCAAIGHGGVKEGQVISRLKEDFLKETEKNKILEISDFNLAEDDIAKHKNKKSGIIVKGVGDIDVRFSKCCSPVPGDEIVGFITRGRGVSLHRTDCINIICLDEINRQRLIEAEWQIPDNSTENIKYVTDIKITTDDRNTMLLDLSKAFSDDRLQIRTIHAKTVNGESTYDVGIEIAGKEQLERVRTKLLNLPGVRDVVRLQG